MNKKENLDEFLKNAKKDVREKLKSKFVSQSFDKGQFVFFEGDKAKALYLIESGVLESNIIHGDGKVFIYCFLFPGDFFGEGVLYGEEIYPFSAMVRKDAVVWKIGKDELLPLVDSDPSLQRYFTDVLGCKLEQSYVKARCISGERVEKRVACILWKTLNSSGLIHGCEEKFDAPLTNRDISALIGSTEETVSRIMSRLKKEGIIAVKDKQLVVLNEKALMGYFDSL